MAELKNEFSGPFEIHSAITQLSARQLFQARILDWIILLIESETVNK